MAGKLEAFAHLIGKMPDAKIAAMADVPVGVVAAKRKRDQIPAFDGVLDEEPPPADGQPAPAETPAPAPEPPKATATAPKKAVTAAKPAPSAPPEKKSAAPSEIRLTKSVRITLGGIDAYIPASIYRGERAAQIWNDERVPRNTIQILKS